MQDLQIYTLTSKGENELRGSGTMLSPTHIELLVRIDGRLTIGQLRASMSAISAHVFDSTLQDLIDLRMLVKAETDLFAEQFQIHLDKSVLSLAEAEADSGTSSLTRAGYYVGIARKRGPARVLKPGEVLSAVVVEDELILAKFIQSYLSFEGFQVRLATKRAEIVAEFNNPITPDLILLDVMLPDADGFDVLLRIRRHPVLKNVPVIMLTGKATREAVIQGLASGADGYITKPFQADALTSAIRTVLGLIEDPGVLPKSQDLWTSKDSYP